MVHGCTFRCVRAMCCCRCQQCGCFTETREKHQCLKRPEMESSRMHAAGLFQSSTQSRPNIETGSMCAPMHCTTVAPHPACVGQTASPLTQFSLEEAPGTVFTSVQPTDPIPLQPLFQPMHQHQALNSLATTVSRPSGSAAQPPSQLTANEIPPAHAAIQSQRAMCVDFASTWDDEGFPDIEQFTPPSSPAHQRSHISEQLRRATAPERAHVGITAPPQSRTHRTLQTLTNADKRH
jgi:hypothetical protein